MFSTRIALLLIVTCGFSQIRSQIIKALLVSYQVQQESVQNIKDVPADPMSNSDTRDGTIVYTDYFNDVPRAIIIICPKIPGIGRFCDQVMESRKFEPSKQQEFLNSKKGQDAGLEATGGSGEPEKSKTSGGSGEPQKTETSGGSGEPQKTETPEDSKEPQETEASDDSKEPQHFEGSGTAEEETKKPRISIHKFIRIGAPPSPIHTQKLASKAITSLVIGG